MKPVFYLCYSDIPGRIGYLFPVELKNSSYAPGSWFINLSNSESLPELLEFDAVIDNELVVLKLQRLNRSVYFVETNRFGRFFFRAIKNIHRVDRYVGESKLLDSESALYHLIPMNINILEETCKTRKFFFVGRIDNSIEKLKEYNK